MQIDTRLLGVERYGRDKGTIVLEVETICFEKKGGTKVSLRIRTKKQARYSLATFLGIGVVWLGWDNLFIVDYVVLRAK